MTFGLKQMLGAIIEDDGPAPQPHVDSPSAPVAVAQTAYTAAPVTGEVSDKQDDAYQRLAAKTDWTTSPAFVAVNRHLAPMAALAIDDKTKFKVAVTQAQALDGIDPAAITQGFEPLKEVLQQAATDFMRRVAEKMASDVDAKKKQAEELQAQAQQLIEESFNAGQRLQIAQHKFDVAFQTRLAEINQEQAKYASLLA